MRAFLFASEIRLCCIPFRRRAFSEIALKQNILQTAAESFCIISRSFQASGSKPSVCFKCAGYNYQHYDK